MTFEEAKSILSNAERIGPYEIYENSGHEAQWFVNDIEVAFGFLEEQIVKFRVVDGEMTKIIGFYGSEAAELLACGTRIDPE